MTRTSAEIFKDLRSAMAELEHALKAEGKGTDEELSPLLKAALEKPVFKVSEPQQAANEMFSRQAHALGPPEPLPRQERRDRLKDYTPADDPDWDNSVFLGTGDRRVE
jgi:hypothetical protein